MEITQITIKPPVTRDTKLLAFVTIVFENSFVVHDVRIIQGLESLVVAMPDKLLPTRCNHCNAKLRERGKFCLRCGGELEFQVMNYVDVAHPITPAFRQYVDTKVIEEYNKVKDSFILK